MKLVKYKVQNFRSVKDSGWINCDDVTTLVGINEAGKSNLLLALWKLNPASDGKIDFLHDLPVAELSILRDKQDETPFITAELEVTESTVKIIAEEVNCDEKGLSTISVTRFYDGHYCFGFDNNIRPKSLRKKVEKKIDEEGNSIDEEFDEDYTDKELYDAILKRLPKFVYYSNYGNLSTRIYLPHVVSWLKGETVPGIDINNDQVRTLRVLFKYVNLQPQEILNLGIDNSSHTKSEIEQIEKKKEERSILLQSAGTKLTRDFKAWWNQGEYKFRFEADGDYFRIWVSDAKRTDEVSLELRSTGLQWFLSFYLIFLVESQEQHKNCILLLDEAGLTLHPLAQKDLCKFFNSLSESNQIINTTHSPFIIDTNNIDRCKVVYMDSQGYTVVSDNLRDGSDSLNERSIYAVHAALGLSVSDILMQGCKPIIVEGPSDQIYLSAIKQILISQKKIAPKDELIFVPSGGVKGIDGVVSLLCGKNTNGELPFVILDSDSSGLDAKKKLESRLYRDQKNKIIDIKSMTKKANSEIEDLIPYSLLNKSITNLFKSVDDDYDSFDDKYDESKPIVPQIEAYAMETNTKIEAWKVPFAKRVKKQILKSNIDQEVIKMWTSLFTKFINDK